jgi:hypothetical protein
MTVALAFQEYTFSRVDLPSGATEQGPFSLSRASTEEQPGPPVSHSTTGSVATLWRDSKSQK